MIGKASSSLEDSCQRGRPGALLYHSGLKKRFRARFREMSEEGSEEEVDRSFEEEFASVVAPGGHPPLVLGRGRRLHGKDVAWSRYR